MADLTVLVPGSLERLTGGTLYDKRIVHGLRALGWMVDVHEIPGKCAHGDDTTRRAAEHILNIIPEKARVVVDGLILPALSDQLACQAARVRIIVLLHLPVAQAAGLPDATRQELCAREAEGLAKASRIIVPSRTVRRSLIEAGVSGARIGVVVPGTDPAPSARRSEKPDFCRLLCVAAVTEGKGHGFLVEALAKLIAQYLAMTGWGTTTLISSGKDVYIHFAAREFARGLAKDERSKGAVMYLEPGGYYERDLKLTKPTVVLGQGVDPFDAACLGVHVHGKAGDLVASRLSKAGMCAEDLPLAIAEVMA